MKSLNNAKVVIKGIEIDPFSVGGFHMMTSEKIMKLCASHDWTYEFSDDYGGFKKGASERVEILRLISNEFEALYVAQVSLRNGVDLTTQINFRLRELGL